MATIQEPLTLTGHDVIDADGEKIGKVEEVYRDRHTGEASWLAVRTGLFGSRVSFVPLEGAQTTGDDVRVAYRKDQVKDAPNCDADGTLSRGEERRLYEHYSVGWGDFDPDRVSDRDDRYAPAAREGSTDDAMTRSEEELHVGTEQRETGRARLRKYVVTEEVQTTVPVRREEVRVEREPITDANADQALSGPGISEAEHEVTLHAEEPVVEKRVVPKERVRLEKDVVTEERPVTGEVRKERIEAEGDTKA